METPKAGRGAGEQVVDVKLVFATNVWTHHQGPVCRELAALLGGDNFRMCLYERVSQERRQLGWQANPPAEPWIVGPPVHQREKDEVDEAIMTADVAVLGACPRQVIRRRAKSGRLTLLMGERMWKEPFKAWVLHLPRTVIALGRYRWMANRPNAHYLAIGAGAAGDMRRVGVFGDRIWRWAYFLDVSPEPPPVRIGPKARILWAGRMLRLKRVDMLLHAVAQIRDEPDFGGLDLVGDGDERERLTSLSRDLGLAEHVRFHGSIAPERVRQMMRESDIFVLASNRIEGWGAVANEAMSEGSVLVASEEAGATRVLIREGETGLIFSRGRVRGLAEALRRLIRDPALRERIRQAAWRDMNQLWHPRVAADRLVRLCQGLMGRLPVPVYTEGPCSRA